MIIASKTKDLAKTARNTRGITEEADVCLHLAHVIEKVERSKKIRNLLWKMALNDSCTTANFTFGFGFFTDGRCIRPGDCSRSLSSGQETG